MLIFNTTYHLDPNLEEEFLKYIREEYIPEALKSDYLSEPKLRKVLDDSTMSGDSFCLQFSTDNHDTLDKWFEAIGNKVNHDILSKFKEKIVGFSTLLEELSVE